MGLYIRPAELVEKVGRLIELKATRAETEAQLLLGEKMCAVAQRQHGKVALLMERETDFIDVKSSSRGILGLYAIRDGLASQAS